MDNAIKVLILSTVVDIIIKEPITVEGILIGIGASYVVDDYIVAELLGRVAKKYYDGTLTKD